MLGMEETLGFTIADIARLQRRRFDARARLIGATRPQWRTLALVARNEGINQGGLAELLEVEPITACRMIDRLEDAGLIERRRDPADRRAWQLFLTAKARPLIAELRIIGARVSDEALQGLSAAEQAELARLLRRMRENLAASAQAESIEEDAANG